MNGLFCTPDGCAAQDLAAPDDGADAQAGQGPPPVRGKDFDRLTVALLLDLNRRGELPEAILVALLVAVGFEVVDE